MVSAQNKFKEKAYMLIYGELIADPSSIEQEGTQVVVNHRHSITAPGLEDLGAEDIAIPDDEHIRKALQKANLKEPKIALVQQALSTLRQIPDASYEAKYECLSRALSKGGLPVERTPNGDILLQTGEGTGIVLLARPSTSVSSVEQPDIKARALSLAEMFKRSIQEAISMGNSVVIDGNRIQFYQSDEFIRRLQHVATIADSSASEQNKRKAISGLFNISEGSAATLLHQF